MSQGGRSGRKPHLPCRLSVYKFFEEVPTVTSGEVEQQTVSTGGANESLADGVGFEDPVGAWKVGQPRRSTRRAIVDRVCGSLVSAARLCR